MYLNILVHVPVSHAPVIYVFACAWYIILLYLYNVQVYVHVCKCGTILCSRYIFSV